jgi:inorganic triphosphatase YgiF
VKLPERNGAPGRLTRREITFEADGDTIPDRVSTLVRARARSAPLTCIATLITRRRTIELRDIEDRMTVEIDDDDVTAVVDGRETARFRELEVELSLGAPVELLALVLVVAALRRAGARPAEPVPKVVRALGPAAREPPDTTPPTVRRNSPMETVVVAAVTASYTRLVDHDASVRLQRDPEDVQQARVATRRLRSNVSATSNSLTCWWRSTLLRA